MAPFAKLAVDMRPAPGDWGGVVSGVALVHLHEDLDALRDASVTDLRRRAGNATQRALTHIEDTTGWRSQVLEETVDSVSRHVGPYRYDIERLAVTPKRGNLLVIPVIEMTEADAEAVVEFRLATGSVVARETVARTDAPMDYEDLLPAVKARASDGTVEYLDRSGRRVASITQPAVP